MLQSCLANKKPHSESVHILKWDIIQKKKERIKYINSNVRDMERITEIKWLFEC